MQILNDRSTNGQRRSQHVHRPFTAAAAAAAAAVVVTFTWLMAPVGPYLDRHTRSMPRSGINGAAARTLASAQK